MTKQETIEAIASLKRIGVAVDVDSTEYYDAPDSVCEAIDIALECTEKQIPKKPITKKWVAVDDGVMRTFNCPCCGVDYNRFYIGKPYCQYCGQAIDWSDNE